MNILIIIEKDMLIGKMYGMNLPDSILKKVYYKNALKLFPKIPKSFFEEN